MNHFGVWITLALPVPTHAPQLSRDTLHRSKPFRKRNLFHRNGIERENAAFASEMSACAFLKKNIFQKRVFFSMSSASSQDSIERSIEEGVLFLENPVSLSFVGLSESSFGIGALFQSFECKRWHGALFVPERISKWIQMLPFSLCVFPKTVLLSLGLIERRRGFLEAFWSSF